jgi:hypothetical protein
MRVEPKVRSQRRRKTTEYTEKGKKRAGPNILRQPPMSGFFPFDGFCFAFSISASRRRASSLTEEEELPRSRVEPKVRSKISKGKGGLVTKSLS